MFGFGWQPPEQGEYEKHVLILTKEQIDESNLSISQFLIQETAKKGNRLGKECGKVVKAEHEKRDDGGYNIIFYCERGKWW